MIIPIREIETEDFTELTIGRVDRLENILKGKIQTKSIRINDTDKYLWAIDELIGDWTAFIPLPSVELPVASKQSLILYDTDRKEHVSFIKLI